MPALGSTSETSESRVGSGIRAPPLQAKAVVLKARRFFQIPPPTNSWQSKHDAPSRRCPAGSLLPRGLFKLPLRPQVDAGLVAARVAACVTSLRSVALGALQPGVRDPLHPAASPRSFLLPARPLVSITPSSMARACSQPG